MRPSSVSQAVRTWIFGTSTTSRFDSAPTCISSGFRARAPPHQIDLLRHKAPSCEPAQRKKILSCAQEAQFRTGGEHTESEVALKADPLMTGMTAKDAVRKAPAKKVGGSWDSVEGSGRSDEVLERGSSHITSRCRE